MRAWCKLCDDVLYCRDVCFRSSSPFLLLFVLCWAFEAFVQLSIMPNANAGSQAESGIANALVARSTLAALRSQHLERLIDEEGWQSLNNADFHDRVLAQQYRFPEAQENFATSIKRSGSPTSSMAVSITETQSSAFVSSYLTGFTPSLVSGSTWRGDHSARTSRADSVLVMETFDEDGTRTTGGMNGRARRCFECCFGFLGCEYVSTNMEQWDTHCKSHFLGYLPRIVRCSFDCDWTREAATGEQAWQARTIHIWSVHSTTDETVDTTRRPDPALIQHLWSKGIIDNTQQKELRMTGRLSGSQVFLSSAGRLHDDRNRRHPRARVCS